MDETSPNVNLNKEMDKNIDHTMEMKLKQEEELKLLQIQEKESEILKLKQDLYLCHEKRANVLCTSLDITKHEKKINNNILSQYSANEKQVLATTNKDEEIILLKKQIEISERKLLNAKHLSDAHIQFSDQVRIQQENSERQAKEYFHDLKFLKEKYEEMELVLQMKRLTKSCKDNHRKIENLEQNIRESNCNPYLYTKRQIQTFHKRLNFLKRSQQRQMKLLETISLKSKYNEDMRTAVCNTNEKTVRMLLLQGIGVNVPDSTGFTAFMYACGNGPLSMVEMMINIADVNYNNEGNITTPLMLSIKHEQVPIISLLLQHGANVEGKDNVGKTALLTACECSSNLYQIITMLLDYGANVNAVDKYGNTALHLCAELHDRNEDILELFLQRGAEKTIKNYQYFTAQKVAQIHHHFNKSNILRTK